METSSSSSCVATGVSWFPPVALFFDMAKDYAKAFYDSREWKECRKAYIARTDIHGGFCERCLKRGEFKAGVIVHHKIYLTPRNINDPSVTLNFRNLELVCRDCHSEEHTPKTRRYCFTARGEIAPLRKNETQKLTTGG